MLHNSTSEQKSKKWVVSPCLEDLLQGPLNMKEILCARENCELWKSPQHIFCMLQELVTNQLMLKFALNFQGWDYKAPASMWLSWIISVCPHLYVCLLRDAIWDLHAWRINCTSGQVQAANKSQKFCIIAAERIIWGLRTRSCDFQLHRVLGRNSIAYTLPGTHSYICMCLLLSDLTKLHVKLKLLST